MSVMSTSGRRTLAGLERRATQLLENIAAFLLSTLQCSPAKSNEERLFSTNELAIELGLLLAVPRYSLCASAYLVREDLLTWPHKSLLLPAKLRLGDALNMIFCQALPFSPPLTPDGLRR